MVTPKEMLDFVYDNCLDTDFVTSIMMNKMNYSIGEIYDKKYVRRENVFYLKSEGYRLNEAIEDDDIFTALSNGLYVSAFVSRFDNSYRIHFLVHRYPESMKARFEEEITKEVVQYMIYNTIIALKLDNEEKIKNYCGKQ